MNKNEQLNIIASALGIKKGSNNSGAVFKLINKYTSLNKTNAAIIAAITQSSEYKRWKQSEHNNKKVEQKTPVHRDDNSTQVENQTMNICMDSLNNEKHPKYIKDKVLIRSVDSNVDYEEFNSTHDAMKSTGTGTPQDARQFRKVVKAKGCAIWPDDDPRKIPQLALDGKRWEMRLKHSRPAHDELADDVPIKRKGKRASYGSISRPAQKSFSDSVRYNCFGQCVVTGARSKRRGEAAHLVEHCKDGIDHWSNGLWLRIDIHRLFDAHQFAIDPQTLHIRFAPSVLDDDEDLVDYEGKPIASTRKRINVNYLQERWKIFCERHCFGQNSNE